VQEKAVGDGTEQGRERVWRKAGRYGAAFLSGPGEVADSPPKLVQQLGQALAQNGVALGLEHRLGADSRYNLLLLARFAQPWLEQRDEVRQLFERPKLFDRERLLEDPERGLREQLLLAAEVVAHRSVRQAGPRGYGPGRDGAPADLRDQLGAGAQQPLAGLIRRGCPLAYVFVHSDCPSGQIMPRVSHRVPVTTHTIETSEKTMAREPAIEASGLTRRFGETRAVNGLALTVPRGTVYGLLGPNGAGKTTLIRMLATLLRPDAGTARVFGYDIVRQAEEVRRCIALTGQFASIDPELTGVENLILLGRLLGLPRREAKARACELIEMIALGDGGRRQVVNLSGGMRRRLDIAASLIVRPALLFLDEPTTGLDPRSRQQTWEIVRSIVAEGATVVLTTQYLDEADRLASRIAVIDHGSVIAEGTSAELKATVGAGRLEVRLLDPHRRDEAAQLLSRELATSIRLESDPAVLSAQIATTDGAHELGARTVRALNQLLAADVSVEQFALGQPSLDEAFLTLTGRTADPETATAKEL